ncbi:MAG: HlyD family secretion protein [Cyclobacteriaceae bacterium]|jgi:HlyD family secretion protein
MAKKKSNNKLIYILVGLVLVLGIVAIIGKKKGWIGKGNQKEVLYGKPKKVDITEQVSASGMVQPVIEVKISPEVPGEIIDLFVEEGDSVVMGQPLINLRPDNLISALERVQASLNQQKAQQANAKSGYFRAQAQLTRAELDYIRQDGLFKAKAISEADYQLAEANYKIAQQDLKSSEQSVKAAEYIVQSAEASVREARENLSFTRIKAPMNGIVSKLDVEKGERVVGTSQMAGTEMLRIADLNVMEVRVDVNENDIVRVNIGDTAVIDVDSYSYLEKKFKGVVTAIANTANQKASADAVTEFEVKIRILNDSFKDLKTNSKSPFRPGMTASVDIRTDTKTDVLSVPLGAVTTRIPKKEKKEGEEDEKNVKKDDKLEEVIFISEEGKAKMVIVETGISDFENIQILNGLEGDEQIITGPFLSVSKDLKDGDVIAPPKEKKEKDEKEEE